MKLIFPFFLLLSGVTQAHTSERRVNTYASRTQPIRTFTYLTTGMSTEELDHILEEDIDISRTILGREMLKNAVRYILAVPPPLPTEPWTNFAEKRYSYFRDFFSRISVRTDAAWQAHDYQLDDLSYVFYGSEPNTELVIRASDGALFRGELKSPHSPRSRFETLEWLFPPNTWDQAPCSMIGLLGHPSGPK